jgi:hypothetical protein
VLANEAKRMRCAPPLRSDRPRVSSSSRRRAARAKPARGRIATPSPAPCRSALR